MAGITLAIDLAARGRRVLLLEGGDLEFTETSQNTYKGPIIGRNYFDLDFARLRYLGGASNHWAGWCRPLDAWDFEGHAHIPNSGWPIAKADLDRHFERASQILEIPAEYNDKPVEDSDNAFTQFEFQFSPPVRFGEKYLEELKSSTRIDLFVNANLTDIRLTEATDRVTEFQCSNYADTAAKHSFTGAAFVLAIGGIEIPRMMLNFRSQATAGIGNAHDLVGRYFMDHFHASGGVYAARRKDWPYSAKEIHFAPTPEFMAKQRIANAGLRAGPLTDARRALINRAKHSLFCNEDEMRGFARSFFEGSCPADVFTGGYLRVASEQQPNPSSRVSLSDDTDKFRAGLRDRLRDERGAGTVAAEITESAGGAAAADRVRRAARDLPRSWVERGNEIPLMTALEPDERGFHIPSRPGVAAQISAPAAGGISTALHEYVHHVQHAAPALNGLFHGLHRRRTKGEKQVKVGEPDEMGRKDQYIDKYAGREYPPNESPDEVITMAAQQLFHPVDGKEYLKLLIRDDPEMADLILGVLFRYDP